MDTINLAMIRKNINSNIDLDKTLKQLAVKQQYNYYKVAIYDLVFNYITFLEMINEDDTMSILKLDNQSEEIVAFITSILKDYNNLNSCKLDTDDLLGFRKIIQSKIVALAAFSDEIEVYEYIINRTEGRFIQDYIDIEDDESFAGNLIRFIFENEENVIINEKIKAIISQLPVRITKNKFYEYIDTSLDIYKGAYVTDLNNYIEMVKDSIMPMNLEEYNRSFEGIRQSINILEKVDYKNINQEEFEQVYKEKMEVSDKINRISSVYSLGVSLINNLIEISLCDKAHLFINEKDLTGADNILHNISKNVDGFILGEDLSEQLEKIEGIIEESMDNIDKYSNLVQSVIKSHKNDLAELNLVGTYDNLQKVDFMLSTTSYFANPNKILRTDDDNRVDDFTLAKVKKDITQTIDVYIKDKSREYRRAIMGHLFYLLPVSFKTPREIHAYALNSLQQCSDINEKNASKQLIRQIMDEFSY